MRWAVALFVVLLASGCAAPPTRTLHAPFAALHAADANSTSDAVDGARTFGFSGVSPARRANPGDGVIPSATDPAQIILNASFDLDPAVGWIEANLSYDPTVDFLRALVYDAQGRLQCGASYPPVSRCSTPSVGAFSGAHGFVVIVEEDSTTNGGPFSLNLTLHPHGDEQHSADPTSGADASIRFHTGRTGARSSSEDNVGVLADGAIFVQDQYQTMRSTDGGATWIDVAPPEEAALTDANYGCDPLLRADAWSNRVYVAQLGCNSGGSLLLWTSDGGATWQSNPHAGPLPQQDHEKLAIGSSPVPMSPVPAVYYAFTTPGGALDTQGHNPSFVSRSLDGGLAFTTTPLTGTTEETTVDTVGVPAADRLGDVFMPLDTCGPHFYDGGGVSVAVSTDYASTFHLTRISDEPSPCPIGEPMAAVGSDGVAYFAYQRVDHVAYSFSKDRGASWSKPVTVSLSQHTSIADIAVVAGDPGRIAIAYRASSDTTREPTLADGWAAWHMYVAFVENATSAPSTRVALVNAPDAPVQRGCIWQQGGASPCRNLLDFFDAATTPEGRVVLAYPVGCVAPCPTPADSHARIAAYAIEQDGPRLFASKAPWAK